MLISYLVYEPEIGQFVEELKPLKKVTYSVENRAYKVEFEDDSYVYVPKEHRLDEHFFSRKDNNNGSEVNRVVDDYYIITDYRVALRKLDDITEAQLRLNEMCSIEHYNKFGSAYKLLQITDKVFIDTLNSIGKLSDKKYKLKVDSYDGTDIVIRTIHVDCDYDILKEMGVTGDNLEMTPEIKDKILNKVEFR